VAKADDVLENSVTGERLVFRRTAAETGGVVLGYELVFRPEGFVVQQHVHPSQSGRHEVVAGELALISREFEPEGYATRPPLAVQRTLLGPLAALARRRGVHV
jgi:hypothetical protein